MKTYKQIIEEDLKEAQLVDDDMAAVAYCPTRIGAWRKIRKLIKELGYCDVEEVKLENIGIGYIHTNNEDGTPYTNEDGDSWYVNQVKSPLRIWLFEFYPLIPSDE